MLNCLPRSIYQYLSDECLWLRVYTDPPIPITNLDYFVRVEADFPGGWVMYISKRFDKTQEIFNGSDYIFIFYDEASTRWIVNDKDVSSP